MLTSGSQAASRLGLAASVVTVLLVGFCGGDVLAQFPGIARGLRFDPRSHELCAAILAGSIPEVERQLRVGAPVKYGDANPDPLICAAQAKNVELARLLIARGANVRWARKNAAVGSALHQAAGNGDLPMIELLLSAGAEVDNRGGTATPLATAAAARQLDATRRLIGAGADVNRAGELGRPPLWYAIDVDGPNTLPIVELLLEKGANINFKSATEFSHVYQTSVVTGDVNKRVEIGGCDVSALHQAARWRHVDVVELLLRRGADSTIKDPRGRTALDCVKENLADPLFGRNPLPESQKIVELLSKPRS